MLELSIIVPVFNEADTVAKVIDAIKRSSLREYELVVVDDFSTDGTRALLEGVLSAKIDRLILHKSNLGKGAAIRSGFQFAKGRFVVIQDADLEYDPGDLQALLQAAVRGEADVVYGTRFPRGLGGDMAPFWHKLVNRLLSLYSNFFTGLRLTDMETCYKLFPRSLLDRVELREERFGIEPEITAKFAALGLRFLEVPISYRRRTFKEGKKIGAKDGLRALFVITKHGLLDALLP